MGYYWYEREPELYQIEYDAMKKQIDDHGKALSDNVGVARVV